MNANKHLDFYNPDSIYYGNSRHYIQQLENKVRQQQAEINQQQDEKKALYNLVAEQDKKIIDLAFKLAYAERGNEIVAELYTHPKELTDEEIEEVFDREVGLNSACGWEKDFARAILRKAQEK